jgi:molybdate transport system substrate-binding protein
MADNGQSLIVLSTGAYKAALDEILAVFLQETGTPFQAVYDSATNVAARIEAGARFDLAISTTGIMAVLAEKNFLAARWPAGGNAVCLAYRTEVAPPDISTPEALRAVLLASSSISLSDPKHGGGSSKFFVDLLASLGIAEAVSPKLLLTPGGQGVVPVAEQKAEIGIAQTSEIAMLPSLAATPLSGSAVNYELAISAHNPHPASEAFAAFFAGPAGEKIRRNCGLETQ